MNYLPVITLVFILITNGVFAQPGGRSTYGFLSLPNSARIGALGGNVVSLHDADLNLVANNPATADSLIHGQLATNYVNYFAGIQWGYAAYAFSAPYKGTFCIGTQYINYGKFKEATVGGELTGNTFTAAEYAPMLSYARPLSARWTAGAGVKMIFSDLESYFSAGIATDLGAIYTHDSLLSVGFVVKNAGFQITTYTGTREPLPFDIQIGMSKKLAHAPIRLSFTAQHLSSWSMITENNLVDSTDDFFARSMVMADNLLRHAVIGIEIMPTRNFHVRAGYNHQRKQEMGLLTRPTASGFSAGFGFRIKRLDVSYGFAAYHAAGSSHHFSLSTNLNTFYRKL